MTNKTLVRTGLYTTGDIIHGKTITGLGKPFTIAVPDEDACVWGLPPGNDYQLTVQYAYLEGK